MTRRVVWAGCLLILLLAACQGQGDGRLAVDFPLETTELTGGQVLRVTVSLADPNGQPVAGATVRAELKAPNGQVFATLPCVDKGQGRYLADYVTLPLRGAGGTWRVVAQATWGEGKQAQTERAFKGLPSASERLQRKYGFWIDPPHLFEYNEVHPADPHFEERTYEDGGGYVLLENNIPSGITHIIVSLDVHWRRADLPADEAAALAQVRSLAVTNRHDSDPPGINLAAAPATFQGRPAWRVAGQWKETPLTKSSYGGPAEWLIFRCPGSDWLWTLVISTNEPAYMDDLRRLRETFECPTTDRKPG